MNLKDEIENLQKCYANYLSPELYPTFGVMSHDNFKRNITALLERICLDLIGEMEEVSMYRINGGKPHPGQPAAFARNKLRAEQRNKLAGLLKGAAE